MREHYYYAEQHVATGAEHYYRGLTTGGGEQEFADDQWSTVAVLNGGQQLGI